MGKTFDLHSPAEALKDFEPPKGWGVMGKGGNKKMKSYFIEFFQTYGGFTTHR